MRPLKITYCHGLKTFIGNQKVDCISFGNRGFFWIIFTTHYPLRMSYYKFPKNFLYNFNANLLRCPIRRQFEPNHVSGALSAVRCQTTVFSFRLPKKIEESWRLRYRNSFVSQLDVAYVDDNAQIK